MSECIHSYIFFQNVNEKIILQSQFRAQHIGHEKNILFTWFCVHEVRDRTVRQAEKGEGEDAGLSLLRTRLPLLTAHLKQNSSTNCLLSQFKSSRVLLATAQDSHTVPVLSFSVSLSVLLWLPLPCLSETCLLSTCGTCPWQVMRILHHRNRAAASTMHPLFLPFLSFTLTFLILSCRGKRRPEESNNCDSGAFWHCSWSCADTHRAVCWL